MKREIYAGYGAVVLVMLVIDVFLIGGFINGNGVGFWVGLAAIIYCMIHIFVAGALAALLLHLFLT